jgi:hypothetical protein
MSTGRDVTQSETSRADLAKIWRDLFGVENEKGFAYSSPKLLHDTLRKVNDRAVGHPATGYDAISQQDAGDLGDRIARALSEWEPKLEEANRFYKYRAQNLYATKTLRGSRALKRQKFDYNQLATDPQSLPNLFFKSEQGVDDLINLTGGNRDQVEKFAWDHVLDSLRGKTPQQAAQWLEAQRSWLNPDTLRETFAKATNLIDKSNYAASKAATAAGQAKGAVGRGRELRDALRTGASKIEDLAKPIPSVEPKPVAPVVPEPVTPVEPKPVTPKEAKEIPPPAPGPRQQELGAARETIASLERNFINKGVKPAELVTKIRSLLNSTSVNKVVSTETAQRINAELDEIEKLQGHEAMIRKIADIVGRWGLLPALIGSYELRHVITGTAGAMH